MGYNKKVNELSGIKVGDKVTIKGGMSHESEKRHGQTGVVIEIRNEPYAGHVGWAYVDNSDGGGIWLDELTKEDYNLISKVDDDPNAVVKRTSIEVKNGELAVQHTTNSKRNRVGFLKQGRVIGHIRYDEIDQYIELLNKLKEEVDGEV